MTPERWKIRAGFAAAAAATTVLAIPVHRLLKASGRLDVPNHRSSHSTPVPRGGGIAALLGATTTALVTGVRPSRATSGSIMSLAALGWADDVSGHVPAGVRLAGQFALGAAGHSRGSWDRLTGAVVTSGVVNVVNFMDGINGMSGLTALVWGANAMLLEDESGGELAKIGALTAGASLGFLPHNAPRARLFLGDVGSYALGAAMAAGIMTQRSVRNRYSVAAPLLLYGADAAQALLRRAVAGDRLSEAHRQHVYQRLVDGGRAHVEVALLHAAGAAAIAAASRIRPTISAPVTAALVFVYLRSPQYARRPSAASSIAGPTL